MRSLTGQPSAVQALKERSTRLRVSIDRTGSGSWVDLSDYEDVDWIDSVEYEDNGDNPVGSASVRLRREWGSEDGNIYKSLSPLMAASKLNSGGVLVFPKRKIKIEVSVMPRGAAAAASDWFNVFEGRIDGIDWDKSPIDLKCRDKGGNLQDGWVETQKVYGTGAGRAIESVMQDILDDAWNNGWIPEAVTLYSRNGTGGTPFAPADSPGFLITEYKQGREPVMDALQKLARLIGWECRYRWNASTSAWQLTLYEPLRAVRSRGTITISGTPLNNETFVIDTVTYTAKTSGATTDQFNIGASTTATATNIAAMLNAGSGKSNINAWANGSTVIVEWQEPGTAGNSKTFTEAMTGVTMNGGGVLGGTRSGAAASVNHTFGTDEYYEPQQLSINVADVRNAFSGTFEDATNGRTTITRINSASITKYTRRPFILTEAASSQLDSITEMINLLDAADHDLSEPDLALAQPVPFFPWGEAGDYYTFEANGVHYDSNQSLAAQSLRHQIVADGQSRTFIVARGKPALGPTRWLEAEGRPGVAPPPDIFADEAAQSPVASAGLGTVIVTYDDPRTMDPPIDDWFTTKCYVSTSSGFTPGPSSLSAQGRQTRFEINGLTPGTTYYVKLQIIDEAGNVASTSTQVSVATQRVGPHHENGDSQSHDQLIRNGDFNIWTLGDGVMPDFWNVATGTYGSGAGGEIYFTTAIATTGNRAMELDVTATVNPAIRTDPIPLGAGELVMVGILAHATVAAASTDVRLKCRWLDSAQALISTSETALEVPQTTYGERTSAVFEAPANTRFVEVEIQAVRDGSDYTLRLDRVGLVRAYGTARREKANFQDIAVAETDATVDFETAKSEELGVTYSAGEYTITKPGAWIWSASVFTFVNGGGTAHDQETRIEVDTGGGYVNAVNKREVSVASWSHLCQVIVQTPVIHLDAGDKVRVRTKLSTVTAGSDGVLSGTNCWVAGRQLERDTK